MHGFFLRDSGLNTKLNTHINQIFNLMQFQVVRKKLCSFKVASIEPKMLRKCEEIHPVSHDFEE